MFFTYLGRELRRRARQAIVIALGLALGIGLVITVTALSAGVRDAQGEVLHSLYGVGTDITVTKSPSFGSGVGGPFGFRVKRGTRTRPAAGTKINISLLHSQSLALLSSADVTKVAGLHDVAGVAGGLTLTDTVLTGKIPAFNSGGGGFPGGGGGRPSGSLTATSFTVDGVDAFRGALGPLSSGKLSSGRTFRASDAASNVALVNSNYASQNELKVGSTVIVAKARFNVIGIVAMPASGTTDVFIPLARAQALASGPNGSSLTNDVNTIYVAADNSADISTVTKEISAALHGTTVTNSSDLANEVTGSLSSASSLANNLGRWLSAAVLAAAFLLASLLTMAAVSRRVREFGTLKALGWPSRRVVGQVIGEAVAIGIVGGIVGVGLGYLGSALVSHFASPLTAALGQTTGSATPGGARTFTGGAFPGGAFPGGGGSSGSGRPGGFFQRLASEVGHNVAVHLTAPVTIDAIVAAVLLAIAGGLVAGAFGGWRAARLRPAAALSRVE